MGIRRNGIPHKTLTLQNNQNGIPFSQEHTVTFCVFLSQVPTGILIFRICAESGCFYLEAALPEGFQVPPLRVRVRRHGQLSVSGEVGGVIVTG